MKLILLLTLLSACASKPLVLMDTCKPFKGMSIDGHQVGECERANL